MAAVNGSRRPDLERIGAALEAAASALAPFTPGAISAELKVGGDPVTEADRAVNAVLVDLLPRPGEGWMSEETADTPDRLDCARVWVVDPIDGTREFLQGIPEWCISVGLVEGEEAVAGGILNPSTGEMILGSTDDGLTLNGRPTAVDLGATRLEGRRVLASRSEIARGEWAGFSDGAFDVHPMGSVAYKLARVAAGLDVATWTLVPKHEWDVAAGTALVLAGGGLVVTTEGESPRFNRRSPLFPGLVACAPNVADEVLTLLGISRRDRIGPTAGR